MVYYNKDCDYLHDVRHSVLDGDECAASFHFSDFLCGEHIEFDVFKVVVAAFFGEEDIFDVADISYDVWVKSWRDLSV